MADRGAATGTPAEAARRSIGTIPGLDGIRGLCLLVIVVFHSGSTSGDHGLLPGAFLTIPTFFALSGFLITALLTLELDRTERIDLRAFWARRLRRLAPAALLGIAVVLAYGTIAADGSQLATLRSDITAAVTYTTNWYQLREGHVYAEQLGSPSPLLHYWSLAIEEQFYLALPLVLLAARRLGRGRRSVQPAALAVLALASAAVVGALVVGDAHADRLYYGTDARAVEFLAGALLGTWFARHLDGFAARRRALDVLGWFGLATSATLWATVQLDGGWVTGGGLLVAIPPSLALVAGAAAGGSLGRQLSRGPLPWLGRISYGGYVLHWPIVLWCSPDRLGTSVWVALPLQLALTIALASASYVVLEQPVRLGRLLPGRHAAVALATAATLVIATAQPVAERGPAAPRDFADAEARLEEIASADVAGGLPLVGFFGDSTAVVMALGFDTWSRTDGRFASAASGAAGGCGIAGTDDFLSDGAPIRSPDCADWQVRWETALQRRAPDVAVVSLISEARSMRLPGTDDYRGVEDPEVREHVHQQMLDAVDLLHGTGAHVLWVRQAHVMFGSPEGAPTTADWDENDPARIDLLNELVDRLPEERPGAVTVVDLGTYLDALPGGEMSRAHRSDLLHLDDDVARQVAAELLGPAVERALATAEARP